MAIRKNKKLLSCISKKTGDIIVFALVFMSIFLIMAAGVLGVVSINHKYTRQKEAQTHAIEIAEAGINYYHWHLAHNPHDYSDGNGGTGCSVNPPYTCGPYTHDYLNDVGQKIGSFELEITPPPAGSTIVEIKSTGWLDSYPQVERILSTQFGIPSLAEFLFLEDSQMNFSPTSETWGKVHSNRKIQFNGTNHSTVESAWHNNGVWGTGGPQDLWNWPVPEIDFNKVTIDLSALADEADNNGIFLANSGEEGYHLVLRADNTVDIYEVTRLRSPRSNFRIRNETFIENRSLENIHAFFVEDHLWIEGTVTGLLTIGSARFPDINPTNTNIYLLNNIIYETKDKDHVLGLIAQKSIYITRDAPDTMIIEAHLLAQKGSITRYCYSPDLKDSLTVYGSLISDDPGGFKCGNPVWSGFLDTYYFPNPEAIYHPPPMFPITTTSTILSWEEIE